MCRVMSFVSTSKNDTPTVSIMDQLYLICLERVWSTIDLVCTMIDYSTGK